MRSPLLTTLLVVLILGASCSASPDASQEPEGEQSTVVNSDLTQRAISALAEVGVLAQRSG